MKKALSALLVAALLGTMAGCGSSSNSDSAAEATTESGETEYKYNEIDIDASEYVKLGQYKGLTIEGAKVNVTEEDIDEYIEEQKDDFIEYQKIEDRDTVQDGDMVNVDFETTCDGEAYPALCSSDESIYIGDGDYVWGDDLDLESALIGHKVGEQVTVKGKVSDDFGFEDLEDKEIEVKVTINYLVEEVYPEITDEFVKNNLAYLGCETLEDYRNYARQELESEQEDDLDDENKSQLWELVVYGSEQIQDFPDDIMKLEEENCINYEKEWADYAGYTVGDTDEEIEAYFQEAYGMSLEDYAKDCLLRECVLDLIVEAENIEPTDEEIDEAIEQEVEEGYYSDEEEALEYTSRDDIKSELTYNKVMDILVDNATIK